MNKTEVFFEKLESKKESEIYKRLQVLVVNTPVFETEDKLQILRLLFEQEDLALYSESREERVDV